jgi:hypothetical protein
LILILMPSLDPLIALAAHDRHAAER